MRTATRPPPVANIAIPIPPTALIPAWLQLTPPCDETTVGGGVPDAFGGM